jgi:threonylcarbamoyladenosine tRNA methylthiotransferase MtaB
MPHFHIPLQSGSDIILEKMKRRYQTKLYRNKVKKIVTEVKDACIGADVIVGFPGETNEEFNKTLHFIKDLPISYLHVFSYSERENTPAIEFDNKVPKKIKAERSKKLRILSKKLQRAFYQKYLNTEHTALFEQEDHNGMLYGFTNNYIKVKVSFKERICKTKQQIKLLEIDSDGIMKAELLSTKK